MINIDQWLQAAQRRLKNVSITSARLDAEILLGDALGKDRGWLAAHGDEPLNKAVAAKANRKLARREQREPLGYIRGFKEFYGRDFAVSPDVLIPRPESEALIELAKNCSLQAGRSVLDAGTGSGCLGITLKCELPAVSVTLLDNSPAALKVARQNAAALGASVSFEQKDITQLQAGSKLQHAPYSLVVANLPYVDTAWQRSPETGFEPAEALFSEAGGLWHYLHLFSAAPHFLTRRGYLLIEADPRQHAALSRYALKLSFELAAYDGFALLFSRVPRQPETSADGKPAYEVF